MLDSVGALYPFMVHWIAREDRPEEHKLEIIKDSSAVHMVACMFHMTAEDVALDVRKFRNLDSHEGWKLYREVHPR